MKSYTSFGLRTGTLLLSGLHLLHAQGQPPSGAAEAKPEPGTLNSLFNGKLPEAIGKSKLSLNTRLRYEIADQNSITGADLAPSHAPTLRTRFGLTTAPLYGFQGMLEGENITALGSKNLYNAAGSNPGGAGKTPIADPPTTELNQAWVSYSNWASIAKAGRQRIVLDNSRFVGDVIWRQNQQTYDAAIFENHSLPDLSIFYGYLWEVRRIFGDVDGLPAAFGNFESSSHLINLAYDGCPYGKLVGYTYLLDLENGAAGSQANSAASYGASFAGAQPVSEKVTIDYRAEFAWQTDYANSPLSYAAEYYHFSLGANIKPVAFGAACEVLGSDNGQGFRTPLALLHGFNGWADVFLNTPPQGLRDFHAFLQVTLPHQIPLRFVYHKFDADSGGADFGYELDALISKKLGKHWTALAKYAFYDGKEAPAAIDVQRFWLELNFNY